MTIMSKNVSSKYVIFIAAVVSLGGFLFGFDASVISGVTGFIVPEFDLNDWQKGFAVACLTLTSTIAMFVAGPLSDKFGRKGLLIFVGLFYALSAFLSAIAPSYVVLVIARMLGGFAVGAALILAPMYIAEISPAEQRGRMVSINQLNIVLGFSAAYFCNYYILQWSGSDASWVKSIGLDTMTWRWMLGIELVPALLYFLLMFLVPESPRWLLMKGKHEEAEKVIAKINGAENANAIKNQILSNINNDKNKAKPSLSELFNPTLKLVLAIGLIVGVAQQITGINAIFFYATDIFEQSGIGQNAAFAQAVLIGVINVVFTIIAMSLIDRMGRKPLLLIGLAGIVISMSIAAYGFHSATYSLTEETVSELSDDLDKTKLAPLVGQAFANDVEFKREVKNALGNVEASKHEADIIKAAVDMNPLLILIGILGFVASFAISLGPVMWVLFSEIFPNYIRGIAISFVGFVNSAVSYLVQQFFPWELANFGNALTFIIYGVFALIAFVLIYRILPETKGKSLEELETLLIK